MNKKDIVYRLRDRLEMVRIEYQWIVTGGKDPLCEEAADVIERLRSALNQLDELFEDDSQAQHIIASALNRVTA